jgi:hypothetical protein
MARRVASRAVIRSPVYWMTLFAGRDRFFREHSEPFDARPANAEFGTGNLRV